MSEYFLKGRPDEETWTQEGCYITELCNASDIPDTSLALARVKPGVTTQLHLLEGTAEVYVVIEGTGEMEVGEDRFRVSAGDKVMIPAGVPQRITATGEEDLRFYCLCTPRFLPACYVALE